MERKPQLQPGHWYLVYSQDGDATSIRAYMADGGWYPANPEPTQVICEMSRTKHADNVGIADNFVVNESDRAVIELQFPLAADQPAVTRGIRALAERLCVASGDTWDPEWVWDPANEPNVTDNRQARFLVIAAAVCHQFAGANPQIRKWTEVQATLGDPEGIFQPKRWPTETLPGAVPLRR